MYKIPRYKLVFLCFTCFSFVFVFSKTLFLQCIRRQLTVFHSRDKQKHKHKHKLVRTAAIHIRINISTSIKAQLNRLNICLNILSCNICWELMLRSFDTPFVSTSSQHFFYSRNVEAVWHGMVSTSLNITQQMSCENDETVWSAYKKNEHTCSSHVVSISTRRRATSSSVELLLCVTLPK